MRPSTAPTQTKEPDQMLETIASIVATAGFAILPFALLDIVARLFGVDSTEMTAAGDRPS